MITFLSGQLVEALPTQVVVKVGGVGYEVLIPLSSFDRLPGVGQDVHLWTHLSVREDAHVLYGFVTSAERELFRLLVNTVSGIGPKMALNVLSGMTPASFRGAVSTGDVRALSQISGIGKKTAERIVVELKDRLGGLGLGMAGAGEAGAPGGGAGGVGGGDQRVQDGVAARVALGFKQPEAFESIRAARALLGAEASVEALVRASLKKGG
jgi:Holliday junction DNA helicase RuvA